MVCRITPLDEVPTILSSVFSLQVLCEGVSQAATHARNRYWHRCGMFLVLLLAMFYLDPTTSFQKSSKKITFRKKEGARKRSSEYTFNLNFQTFSSSAPSFSGKQWVQTKHDMCMSFFRLGKITCPSLHEDPEVRFGKIRNGILLYTIYIFGKHSVPSWNNCTHAE